MPTHPDTFATRLRSLRTEAGLSVYALAQRSGVSRMYLGELERGTKEPSLEVARKIAVALGRGLAPAMEVYHSDFFWKKSPTALDD